ncbi:hypothetical protein F5Y04DRAFT_245120 [Hypomontagnella monticulosa]|nr:hypothetical protein F5Y04DRAFT_245120 [Hypomontagnella monticulosa]
MSPAITTGAVGQAAESGPKHRACDECRTRKLACTKEPDGCSRCKREGITCHYSPQKPMGRPRKRPRDETNNDSTAVTPAPKNTMTQVPPDTSDPGLAFISMLTSDSDFDLMGSPSQEKGYSWAFGYTGDSLGDIGFDTVPQHTPSFSPPNIDPSLFISALEPPSADQVPNLSPNSASTPESVSSSCSTATPSQPSQPSQLPRPSKAPAQTCAHTAALYLALDSMQQVPPGVENAIGHARRATKTAYDVVYCPVCSFKIEPPDHAASADIMRNFQNLMLLAALIPSIVHAYMRILEAVDEEACRATQERRRLIFQLHGFGGIFWDTGDEHQCDTTGELNHREMEPAMWRLAVRALLKADVYGLSGLDADAAEMAPLHIGLKDIVLQMEQKSKARHAVMDAMINSGTWKDTPSSCGLKMHAAGETPTCQKVIAIAKASIDQLIIA